MWRAGRGGAGGGARCGGGFAKYVTGCGERGRRGADRQPACEDGRCCWGLGRVMPPSSASPPSRDGGRGQAAARMPATGIGPANTHLVEVVARGEVLVGRHARKDGVAEPSKYLLHSAVLHGPSAGQARSGCSGAGQRRREQGRTFVLRCGRPYTAVHRHACQESGRAPHLGFVPHDPIEHQEAGQLVGRQP